MTFKEWRSLFRFDRTVDIPHLSVTVMCPYAFVRVLWYFNRREFQAWPSEYETSLVLGWRWPFTKNFKEKKWARYQQMPMALYGGPMDQIYLVRACHELGIGSESMEDGRYIGPTVRAVLQVEPKCQHTYWVASCPQCARKALRLAINLKTKYDPVKLIDPHESPIDGFRRREVEAELKAAAALALPEATEDLQG